MERVSTRKTAAKPDSSDQMEVFDFTESPKYNLPAGYLSYTQMDMYYRCPQQYYFRYVLGLKEPPAVALVEGGCHHDALFHNNAHKIKTGKDLDRQTMYEKFADEFTKECKQISDWEGDNPEAVIKRGNKLINNYLGDVAPHIYPHEAELEIGTKEDGGRGKGMYEIVPGVPFLGYVDLLYSKIRASTKPSLVADYKVVGRKRSQAEVDNDLQLTLYMHSTNKQAGSIICFGKKTGRIDIVSTTRNKLQTGWALNLARHAAQQISAGNFPPVSTKPMGWNFCSPDYCGFWKRCRGNDEWTKLTIPF